MIVFVLSIIWSLKFAMDIIYWLAPPRLCFVQWSSVGTCQWKESGVTICWLWKRYGRVHYKLLYILMNIILIKVQMAVSATAGTSTPLAGDYKVDCIGH